MLLVREAAEVSESTQPIDIVFGYPSYLHSKTTLKKISYILATGYRETSSKQNEVSFERTRKY